MSNLKAELNDLLTRHQIPGRHRPLFHQLVREGRIENEEFRTRLKTVVNYETALYEILELLSRSCKHLFEPTSFESLVPIGVHPNGN